ncbi:Fic family protein [Candidatus Woesearchaeota archaeon]|nr:Fic family protein [Candidatus Woesearchaeota archaeon]
MFVEKRKAGKNIKYFLVHSYRENGKVRKIRKYLGQNLGKEELKETKDKAKKHVLGILQELKTEVFLFTLTKNQINKLNKYENKIKIMHFDSREWQRFTEEFVFNTNAIEGSTVQREEVPDILHKPKAEGAEEIETKGVAKAVDYIKKTKEDLSIELIKKLHEICFNGSKSFAGQLRSVEVAVVDSKGEVLHRGVSVSDLHLALKDMISWYKENKQKFRPLVLAAIIHNQFEYIHPFQDGNGRVGRLLLNLILLKSKYPPLNITLENRAEYYRTLQEYQKNQNLKPTVEFLVKQYKKTITKVTTKQGKV